MAFGTIYTQLLGLKQAGRSGFAVLVDPDKTPAAHMGRIAALCQEHRVDYLLVGGSLLLQHQLEACISSFKAECDVPVILFPGSPLQVCPLADALLYLSLISGRNPELLIGQHVISAPLVRASGLEVIPTGYMVIDGGRPTTVSYMSNSAPIPADKADVALCTAWAGELLGQQLIYMDAGSGAPNPVAAEMITKVSSNIALPLFVGGGMRSPEQVYAGCRAGASVVVVGNAIEQDSRLIAELAQASREAAAPVN